MKILIPNIDKLRGFAALSVLFYHVIMLTIWEKTYPKSGVFLWGRIGWMGVDLFFVISGLVIAYSAWSLVSNNSNWRTLFWNHRFSRILPLYFLTLICFMVFVEPRLLSFNLDSLFNVATHLLFIHNFFPITHGAINGVNWSVAVEMQFYLLITIMLPWIMRASISRIFIICIIIAWCWRHSIFMLTVGQDPNTMVQYTTQLPGIIDEFMFGIVLCKIFMDSRYSGIKNIILAKKNILAPALIAGSILTIIITYHYIHYFDFIYRSILGLAASFLVLGAMIWPWSVMRCFSWPLDFFGKVSYGLYLWHVPVILSLNKTGEVSGPVFLLKTLIITTFLATLSHYFFERIWMRRDWSMNWSFRSFFRK